MHTLGSDVSDHTHSEPFHVYSDLTELKAVKAKATTKITDTSLRNDLIFLLYFDYEVRNTCNTCKNVFLHVEFMSFRYYGGLN